MKKLIVCKVCGFVMEAKDLKDVCPACGIPKTAFIDYKYSINEKRQEKLNLHIHPITVHFPEAIAAFIVGFMFLSFITPSSISSDLLTTNRILSIFFPLTVLIASASGIYDSKIRFKKLSPPYIKTKICLGATLLIVSLLVTYLFQIDYSSTNIKAVIFILSLINFALSVTLGRMGGKLIYSRMPG